MSKQSGDLVDIDRVRAIGNRNSRPRPWILEQRYIRGYGSHWGWFRIGRYRSQKDAEVVMKKKQGQQFRIFDVEFKIIRTDKGE